MLSIWEKKYFTTYDAIIIGSGIVGLSTAYYLKKKNPNARIAILERAILPSGASTKNAGFACMGSPTELLDDLKHSSENEVIQLFLLRKQGLERLQHILGSGNIGYQASGSYELLMEEDLAVLDRMDYLNNLLQKELGTAAFQLCSEKLHGFQFNNQHVKAMIENKLEGEIDTGKMMWHFAHLIRSMDITCYTGALVTSFQETGTGVDVQCRDASTQQITFHANQLFVCNNAFACSLLPDYDVVPGRGQVLLTQPIPNLPFKGIFHFNQGYYYFREYDGCVLFGGGRQLDKETESTTNFALNETIQADLDEKLRTLILPNTPVEVAQRWTGIMAFGETKQPIVKQHSDHLFVGVRMGGMGVAIGSEIGYQLSLLSEL